VQGRNPSLTAKAGLGAGSALPGLGWRPGRRPIPATARITSKVTMHMSSPRPVVHPELHTGDHARASAFYAELLCWRQELPYVQVGQIEESTERARQLGASVLLAPREGPAGWRNVISALQCGEPAIWQPKP
jgi:predicted enzyme related to lactoylglutathione lyase